MAQMTISMRQKHSQILYREQTCGCQGEGSGKGWIRSLGLADANWYIKNEQGLTV